MKEIFEKLYQGNDLTESEMTQLAEMIFTGELKDTQISAALIALKMKGITSTEMAAIAKVMQKNALTIENAPVNAMDNCGTGGDHSNSFNVSTTTAFVLAAGGIPMAKHGNRSISSRSGSADVLEELGVKLTTSQEQISQLLNEIGIAFLFAQAMHPSMRYVINVRRELATPTILNLIGPLTNPVNLETQLMGTFAESLLKETAETLGKLGRKRAIVLQGAYGMDEANLAGDTKFALLEDGKVEEYTVSAAGVGLPEYPLEAIVGGDAKRNAEILVSVLENQPSPFLDTVLLNAGLGFYANGKVNSVKEGVEEARKIIASGAAREKLAQLIEKQKEVQ
ncbi:MAG TPA: anthranilate phosphoribosyltransferase [Enterococcus sp.]|nr:anthranilate phosphoribosyltransferase [Enterococcus sp.]HPR80359.1 anthranilate phosphoribosyltransferase [Enterococcus sp.]